MNQKITKRSVHFFAAAAFSVLFMMLFAFIIPSVKASADQSFTAPYTGRTIPYSKSGVTYVSSSGFVTAKCNGVSGGVSQFTITVSPNTTTYSRSATLYAKKSVNGATVEKINITQAAAPSPQYITLPSANTSVSCVGGQVYCSVSGSKYEYLNKDICDSHNGNYLVVKPNTATSFRSCKVNIKDGNGYLRAVVTIRQSGVPKYTPSRIACTGGSVPSPASGADYSKTVYSNPDVCNSISGGKFIVKANNTTKERKCTITVKNSAGRIIYYIYITQNKVPLVTKSIAGGGGSFGCQYNMTVSLTPTKANTIDVTASAPSGGVYNYTVNVSANPSTTANRTFDINVKNSSGNLVEIIRITQSKFVIPTKTLSINSDPQNVVFTFAGAYSKIIYSNTAMFRAATKSGSTFTFNVPQNPSSSSRSNKVTFKDKYGTPIAVFTVNQAGVPLRIEDDADGCPTLFFYRHSGVVSFEDVLTSRDNYAQHVSKYTALAQNQFAIEITANPSTTNNRSFDINVMGNRNNKKVILEIIRVIQSPHEHYYTYTTSNHVYSRKCLYCADKDTNISYQEYLKYNKDKGLTDCDTSVKSYMNALGYGVNSAESKTMVTAYLALHNSKGLPSLLTMNEIQSGLDNLKSITDNIALFSGCDKLGKGLSIASAANHLAMFFIQDNPADKIGNAVKFAGDLLSFGTGGDYFSSALDTVGNALKDTIRTVLKKQDSDFIHALYDYDIINGNYIEKLTLSQIKNDKKLRNIITSTYGKTLSPDKVTEYVEKLYNWKASYNAQAALNRLYTIFGFKVTVPTSDFWSFVNNYIKVKS